MPSIEILMSRSMFKSRAKGINGGIGGSTDAIINVATVEFRFGAVVLTKILVFDKTSKKLA